MSKDPTSPKGISRREFLSRSSAGVYLSGGSFGLLNSLVSQKAQAGELDEAAAGNRLVVIQLTGGNDTLNTVVPYAHTESDIYYGARPDLAIPSNRVLDLDGSFGLHPEMGAIKGLWDSAELGILHGVGYPDPILSHFSALDNWHSATPSGAQSGWLERFFEYLGDNGETNPLVGIELATRAGLMFGNGGQRATIAERGNFTLKSSGLGGSGDRLKDLISGNAGRFRRAAGSPVLESIRASFEQSLLVSETIAAVPSPPGGNYPDSDLGTGLKTVSDIVQAEVPTKVFYLHAEGYDTHSGQIQSDQPTVGRHAELLGDLSASVGAFADDMKGASLWDNTLVFIFSEFSRKVIQNGSSGSDHGAGQAVMMAGGKVVSGMHGTFPSMEFSARVQNNSLDFSTDFRQVYRTIFEKWLGVSPTVTPTLFPEPPVDFSTLSILPELS